MALLPPFLQSFLFQQPSSSSIFITSLPVLTLISLVYLVLSETMGNPLQYSKFWNVKPSSKKQVKISSRTGMLLFYTPAFLAGFASFFLFPGGGFRFLLLKSAVTLHFFKRDFEVLFVHKYSGAMILDSATIISVLYFFGAASMTFIQYLTLGMPEPLIDLKYPGVLLVLVGLFGNLYHHILLSKLRQKNDDQGYKIPKGGLFDLVVCPHYLFEILVFLGFAFIGQTLLSFSIAIGVAMYLAARSYATRKWYLTKFENFPKNVRALIPYVY